VRAAQRGRLLRAVIAAVAATGFNDVTVADIVRGARVSKAAFYAHFADKEDCFLAATREGGELLVGRVAAAARQLTAGASAEDVLRVGLAAFAPASWPGARVCPGLLCGHARGRAPGGAAAPGRAA
jgi:AcrR family transcriptional regulator